MKKAVLFSVFLLESTAAVACVTCNRQIQEALFNSTFYPNLFIMLSAFIVLGVIIAALTRVSTKRYNKRTSTIHNIKERSSVPLASAAAVLGMGIGGFADGIVLHQLLQWHEMLTNKIPADSLVNKSVNMFWDGIFHMFTLITTIIGICLLWRLLRKENLNSSGYLLAGGIAGGWGLFNVVEGIIDHHVLRLHNVREFSPDPDVWNYSFLGFGIALMGIGWAWIKKGEKSGKAAA